MASWSALQTDLGDIILRRLQHHADRVRFGAVCRQWRSCARQNAPPPQFPWLALPDRTFYSLPDSAFQPLPLHLERHRQLPHAQSSCGEWLVFERMDGAYTLVNPFSMSTTMVLPRLPTEPSHAIGDPPPFMKKLVVCSPNLVAAVVGAGWPHRLALCRPGAASWVVVAHDQLNSLHDMIWHRGKLYALHDNQCRLLCISVGEDRDTGEPNVSRVDILAEGSIWELIEPPSPLLYLLESDGALLMVRRGDPNSDMQNPFVGGDSVHYALASGLWVTILYTWPLRTSLAQHLHSPAAPGKDPPPPPSARQQGSSHFAAHPAPEGGALSMAAYSPSGASTLLTNPRTAPARIPGPASRRSSPCAVVGRERRTRRGAVGSVRACFNPLGDERILREALKEPVAFLGGVFAGLLRLDLNEDPLREWVTRTVEASGIAEENSTEESNEGAQDDGPQQIEIE
ncbi:hypothetical protein ACQ4PT_052643 [Festuca glaucescens]